MNPFNKPTSEQLYKSGLIELRTNLTFQDLGESRKWMKRCSIRRNRCYNSFYIWTCIYFSILHLQFCRRYFQSIFCNIFGNIINQSPSHFHERSNSVFKKERQGQCCVLSAKRAVGRWLESIKKYQVPSIKKYQKVSCLEESLE